MDAKETTTEMTKQEMDKLREEAESRIKETPNVAKHLRWGEFGHDGPNPYQVIELLDKAERLDQAAQAWVNGNYDALSAALGGEKRPMGATVNGAVWPNWEWRGGVLVHKSWFTSQG